MIIAACEPAAIAPARCEAKPPSSPFHGLTGGYAAPMESAHFTDITLGVDGNPHNVRVAVDAERDVGEVG